PNQDPHSYEATTQDRLKLSKADLVVENGGGYDAFMTTMLEASGAEIDTIDTVSISGLPGSDDLGNEPHDHAHGEGAEHHHGADDDETRRRGRDPPRRVPARTQRRIPVQREGLQGRAGRTPGADRDGQGRPRW